MPGEGGSGGSSRSQAASNIVSNNPCGTMDCDPVIDIIVTISVILFLSILCCCCRSREVKVAPGGDLRYVPEALGSAPRNGSLTDEEAQRSTDMVTMPSAPDRPVLLGRPDGTFLNDDSSEEFDYLNGAASSRSRILDRRVSDVETQAPPVANSADITSPRVSEEATGLTPRKCARNRLWEVRDQKGIVMDSDPCGAAGLTLFRRNEVP